MSDSIVKQIAGLHRLSVPDLKQRWRDLFGTEAPAYNRAFLIRRLAQPFGRAVPVRPCVFELDPVHAGRARQEWK